MDKIDFYLRHRAEILQWASLEDRTHDMLGDAVKSGDTEQASRLFAGSSGEDEIDFFVRNRFLIAEWNAVQVAAGEALHLELLAAGQRVDFSVREGKRGWSSIRATSSDLEKIYDSYRVEIMLGWTKSDLLSTRRGYPFPRLALSLDPERWTDDGRARLTAATRETAAELGMTKHDKWWCHWRVMDPIANAEELTSYATACVERLNDAAVVLGRIVLDVTADS